MIDRCERPGNKSFKDYGARGISVCPEWRGDFAVFLADMGRRPSALHSIDRIDNERGYERGNCQWVTRDVQVRNKRNNVLITIGNRTTTMAEWSREHGIDSNTVSLRIKKGWDPVVAVTAPACPLRHIHGSGGPCDQPAPGCP